MRLDSDPPRLSSQGDPLLRKALEQARADLPAPDALARLAARLPLEPGPGPGSGSSGSPPNSPAASGGGAGGGVGGVGGGAVGASPTLAVMAIGAVAGIGAAAMLWLVAPEVPTSPVRLDAPTPVLVASAEGPRPAVSASELEIPAPMIPVPNEQAKSPPAPLASPFVRERKALASRAKPISKVGSAPASSVSPDAPARGNETEASLLTQAQGRIGSNPGEALALADRHLALFPQGNMVQEREIIAVSALVALGRTAEARSRAEAFIAAHPQSAHRRRLSALVPGLAGVPEEKQ